MLTDILLQECEPSDDALLSVLFGDDPDLEQAIGEIEDFCSTFTTQVECEAEIIG